MKKERPMKSSRNASRPADDLPPALSAMWRLCKLGYRHEPGLLLAAFLLALLAALPDALLMSIHPGLLLLAVFAVPTALTSVWRPAVERAAQEGAAPFSRLARHLFNTATTATPGKEVRLTRIGQRLAAQRREAWERW